MSRDKIIWFRHEPARWLLSEQRLSFNAAERGLYRDAWDLCLLHGSIPAGTEELKRCLACADAEFQTSWPRVSSNFTADPADPSRLISESALELREESLELSRAHSANGAKGGHAAHRKRGEQPGYNLATAEPEAGLQHLQTHVQTQTNQTNESDKPLRGFSGESYSSNIDALFDWFLNAYPGEKGTNLWPVFDVLPDQEEMFRKNTEAWIASPKYQRGYAPKAYWYLKNKTWLNPPAQAHTGMSYEDTIRLAHKLTEQRERVERGEKV